MKNVKVICGILLVFLLGAACGALGMHIAYKDKMWHRMHGGAAAREEMLVQRLSRKLDLDERQREEVRGIIHETRTEIKNLRRQIQPQVDLAMDKSRVKIQQILRPEQQEKFNQMVARFKARHARDE